MTILALILLSLALLASPVLAIEPVGVTPVQQSDPYNVSVTATANPIGSAVQVIIPVVAGKQIAIHRVSAFCNNTTYPVPQVQILNGSTVIWQSPGQADSTKSVGFADYVFVPGETGSIGNSMTVNTFSCGANPETVSIQATYF